MLMTFVRSVHNPKIMLGMLVKVLCGHPIATRRRLSREGNVTFDDLMRGASDFDGRTITVEGLTPLRYLLPITGGIVTVIAAIRSLGSSCSHETFFICGESWAKSHRYPMRAYRNTFVAGRCRPHFCKSRLFGAGTLDGVVLLSNSFLIQCLAEAGLIGAVPLFKPRRIKDLMAAITERRHGCSLRADIDERI